jgi:hypothetical protein
MKNKLLLSNFEKWFRPISMLKGKSLNVIGSLSVIAVLVFSVFSFNSFAQTTLVNGTQGGGFELGTTFAANGWTVVNPSTDTWQVGSLTSPGVSNGTRSAYVSADNGTTWSYSQLSVFNHLYRDFTIPAGESKLIVSFNWKAMGEGAATSDWDNLKVYLTPTTVTPVSTASVPSNQVSGSGSTNGMYKLSSTNWNSESISVAVVPGQSYRLIFQWKSDILDIANPPAAVDNISVVSSVPGNYISIATGNWGSAATWDANAVPSPADNAIISGGTIVTVDAASQVINNLTVEGTLAYGTTPTQFNVNGDLTVLPTGTLNVFNGTTGKTLFVTKNILNDGIINVSVGTFSAGNLTLNGSAVQTVSGIGTFTSNVIRNLTFSNSSTATPNIVWSFNNIAIAYNLNLTGARVNLGTNKMIFGNLAAGGTLTAPIGSGFLPGGRFSRWWTNAATGTAVTAGTNPTNSTSRYPLISPTGQDRSVYLTRTNATGAVAGELSVVYQHNNTLTSGLSIPDGVYNITDRYNSNWSVSNEGTPVSASSYTVVVIANDAYYATNGNSRIMNQNGPLAGAHQNGTATPGVQRITIPQADLLAAPLYIGINSADIPFASISNGDWNTASIWNKGTVPTCTDFVTIGNGTVVNVNTAGIVSSNLTIASTGTLNVTSGDLTVGCTNNNSILANNGTLTVSGGTLNINGQLISNAGSTFNHSAGNINVDGNNNADPLTSVPSGASIVQLNTNLLNWTGGTLTIVDPHANSTASNSFSYSNSNNVNVTGTHTVKFGNGVSTQAGGNATNGFRINTWASSARITFANLTIDALAGTNRHVSSTYSFGVNGTLLITPTSHFAPLSSTVYAAGNIVNNGKMTTTTTLILANYLSGVESPTTVAQSVGGSGLFENNATTSTASLTGLTVNNTNTLGVTIAAPISISGTLTFTNGIINTTAANVFRVGTATAGGTISGMSTARFVKGPIQRTIASGNTSFVLFPVGKSSYAPISVKPATTAVTVMSGEVFESNTGTANGSIFGLASNRRWEAPIVTGTATSVHVLIQDTNLVATHIPVQAPTAAGEYTNSFGSTSIYAAGPPKTVESVVAATAYTGFVSYATSNVCSGTPAVGASTATATSICLGSPVTLGIQTIPVGTGVTYQWQSSTDGVTYTNIATATNFSYTNTPTAALYYRNQVTCTNSTLSSISTPIQVVFNNNVITTTPGARCGAGSATIGATGSTGTTISWYANATGGASIGSGSTFNTPIITANTTFFAAAETSSPIQAAIGAGALTSSSAGQSLLPGFWGGAKTQYIIRATELTAAGIAAGPITSIGFEPTTSGTTYQGFTVQIGASVANTAPTTTFLSGLSTVYLGTAANNGFTPVANAVNTLAFGTGTGTSASYNWDGVSNIVVSISWSLVPGAATSTGSTMKVDNVGFASTAYRQRDNLTPAAMLAETSVTLTTTFRPRFTINGTGICSSPRVAVPVAFTAAPALTLSGASSSICEGSSTSNVTLTSNVADFSTYTWSPVTGVTGNATTGWIFNPTTTTTYTLTSQSATNCQNISSYVVNVTNVPAPAALAGVSTCAGATSQTINSNGIQLVQTPIVVPFNVTAQPVEVNAAPGNVFATATMPTLPAGAVITSATLSVPSITANGGSWQADVNLGLSGALVNTAAVGTGATNGAGTFNYTRTFTPTIGTGSSINIMYWDAFDDVAGGADATFTLGTGAATLTINYTVPSGISWWSAASGGTQLGTTNSINAIGTSLLPSPAAAGTYTFFAQTENGTCGSFVRTPIVVTVNALPTPTISASNPILCNGSSILLVSSIANGNVWSSSATATNDTLSVSTAGSYTVTVTNTNGCVGTSAPYVTTITALPVVSAGNNQTVCATSNVTLVGSGAPTLTWNNGVVNNTSFVPTATTNYIVTGTAANGCVNTDTVTVTVNALPTPVISGDLVICANETTVLVASAQTGNVWSTTATNDSITLNTAGIYTVTQTDANGCIGVSAPVTLVVNALPNVNAGSDFNVCDNTTTALNGSGASTYVWNNNVTNNVAFLVTETATYTVTGTDANGCVNTDSITVTANPLPLVDAGNNIEQCGDQTVTLTATGATAYAWSGNIANGTSFDAPFGTSVYIVTGVDALGCSNTDAVTVTIYATPTATINAIDAVTLQATPAGASYQWINCATNQAILGAVSPIYVATVNGSYAVIVTGNGGCADTSACFNVTTVGLDKTELDATISLFPNPTTGNVNISMSNDVEVNVTVFDAQGKVVSTLENAQNGSIIGLQDVENGTYLVKVSNEAGSKVFRVVKQ